MVRLVWLAILTTVALPAAVIRGSIVENHTGKPLSRVTVTLQPIAGTPGNAATLRTDRFGAFDFGGLAVGSYILKAAQKGFLPLEYGQKLWNSAGQPIAVAGPDESLFLNLRMLRYGGITGSILDENDIGLWGHDVVAYKNSVPPHLATRATSDDRGVYRISGLEPGVYVVRTAGAQDEQISYAPTFSKESQELANARIVQVFPDEDATGMDIRPAPGNLLSLTATVDIDLDYCPNDLTLTLASEMGRKTLNSCAFQFGSLPPGMYEVYAEAPSVSKSGYAEVALNRDTAVTIMTRNTPSTSFQFSPYRANTNDIQVWARRKDYAGVGTATQFQLVNRSVTLARGRWEVLIAPPQGFYVSGFSGSYQRSANSRPDGWNEFTSGNTRSIFVSLSGGPSEMHGVVKSYGEPSAGAPVFLEGWDPDTHRRTLDLRMVRTDIHGNYRFQGLAPGNYRVLATFEYTNPDIEAMDLAAAQAIRIEPHGDRQLDLDLYGIR